MVVSFRGWLSATLPHYKQKIKTAFEFKFKYKQKCSYRIEILNLTSARSCKMCKIHLYPKVVLKISASSDNNLNWKTKKVKVTNRILVLDRSLLELPFCLFVLIWVCWWQAKVTLIWHANWQIFHRSLALWRMWKIA